jgi:hypothetical protein
VFADGPRSRVDDLILRRSAGVERQIEARELELEPSDLWGKYAQGLLQQFLPSFIAFEHDDRFGVHGSGH